MTEAVKCFQAVENSAKISITLCIPSSSITKMSVDLGSCQTGGFYEVKYFGFCWIWVHFELLVQFGILIRKGFAFFTPFCSPFAEMFVDLFY